VQPAQFIIYVVVWLMLVVGTLFFGFAQNPKGKNS
jgi:hypothetical protein